MNLHGGTKRCVVCLAFLVASGCQPQGPLVDTGGVAALAACELAAATLGDSAPAPIVGECPDCNGTGKVGDGVVMRTCGRCGGDGRIDDEDFTPPGATPVPKPEDASPQQARDDCAPPIADWRWCLHNGRWWYWQGPKVGPQGEERGGYWMQHVDGAWRRYRPSQMVCTPGGGCRLVPVR